MLFIRGDLAHTPGAPGEFEVLEDQFLAVTPDGRISDIVPGAQEAACLAQHGGSSTNVLRLGVSCLCLQRSGWSRSSADHLPLVAGGLLVPSS